MLASPVNGFLYFFVLSASFSLEASRALGTFLSRRSRQIPLSRKKATEYYSDFFQNRCSVHLPNGGKKMQHKPRAMNVQKMNP